MPEKWTNQEMENLVIGVERYGSDWERIHSSFNFSLSLSYHSLYKKYCKMKKCGDYNKTLLSYGKKVARTIPAASQATQNDKVKFKLNNKLMRAFGLGPFATETLSLTKIISPPLCCPCSALSALTSSCCTAFLSSV